MIGAMERERPEARTGVRSSHRSGQEPAKRDVSGIVILDKSPGLTSNRALQQVKRIFQARKAGHTGSLDPLASGVLPICLGQATKLSTFLLGAEKAYRVTGTFGIKTDTGDADGEIVKRVNATPIDVSDWQRVMTEFTGEIEQVPPMYSALKHKGQPLYKLARQEMTSFGTCAGCCLEETLGVHSCLEFRRRENVSRACPSPFNALIQIA